MLSTKEQMTQRAVLTTAHFDFQKSLNSYAFFKTSDRLIGEDLVQDTFLKTWKYIVKGGKIDMMKSFLYHILNNLIVDEYRKRKNRLSSLDVLLDRGFEPSTGDSERLFNEMDGTAAIMMIQRLPDMYKKIMIMRYVQALTVKEISASTGQSTNTVAVQMHRGLSKLKVLYNNQKQKTCSGQ